jgi:hypothetical protein
MNDMCKDIDCACYDDPEQRRIEDMHTAEKIVPPLLALLDKINEQFEETNSSFQKINQRLQILEHKHERPISRNNRLLRVKLGNQFGSDLEGHWFWLDPADEYAEKALGERYFRPEDRPIVGAGA